MLLDQAYLYEDNGHTNCYIVTLGFGNGKKLNRYLINWSLFTQFTNHLFTLIENGTYKGIIPRNALRGQKIETNYKESTRSFQSTQTRKVKDERKNIMQTYFNNMLRIFKSYGERAVNILLKAIDNIFKVGLFYKLRNVLAAGRIF